MALFNGHEYSKNAGTRNGPNGRATVLLMLGEKSSKALAGALETTGFRAMSVSSVAGVKDFLSIPGNRIAVVDTDFDREITEPVLDLLTTGNPPIPILVLVHEGKVSHTAYIPLLRKFDEIAAVDDDFSTEYLAQRVEALFIKDSTRSKPSPTSPTRRSPQKRGEIIAVFSPKGGAGATTIAADLAVAMAYNQKKQVALIEADLYMGTIDLLLNITEASNQQAYTIYDVVNEANQAQSRQQNEESEKAFDNITPDLLDDMFYTHESGLKVLLGAPRPDLAEEIPTEAIRKVIEAASMMFDFVIIHVSTSYNEITLSAFDLSTTIMVVLVPEMGALRNCNHFIGYAGKFGWSRKLLFVLNRSNSDRFTKITADDVKKFIKAPVMRVVSSGMVVTAANRGEPFVTCFPDEKVSKDVLAIANRFCPIPERTPDGQAPKQTAFGSVFSFLATGGKGR